MIWFAVSFVVTWVAAVLVALAIFWLVASIADYFTGRAKVRRHWQMRQREMFNERIRQSDSARRLLDDLHRQFRDRP